MYININGNAQMLNPEVNIMTICSDLAEERPKTLMQYFLQAAPELLAGLQHVIFRGTLKAHQNNSYAQSTQSTHWTRGHQPTKTESQAK